ncbi:MAG: hypothetical protein IPK19_20750 [Chloroflexi bacterium]|nr:hypothetical protein [Chloroflexota bacterium]
MPLTTDQRGAGFPRVDGAAVDIGAFEADLVTLTVMLNLQGRTMAAPHAAYVISVEMEFLQPDGSAAIYTDTFQSDSYGFISVPNIPAGTYLCSIKGTHTLATRALVDFIEGLDYVTNFLLEGRRQQQQCRQHRRLLLLAAAFATTSGQAAYNPQADFNQDGAVNISDFRCWPPTSCKSATAGCTRERARSTPVDRTRSRGKVIRRVQTG